MNNDSPVRTGLFYGLLSGLGCFGIFVLLFFAHKNPFGLWGWLAAWVPILAMIIGSSVHRDKDLGGYVSFSRVMGICFIIAFSGGLVFEVLTFGFTTLVGDSLVTAH